MSDSTIYLKPIQELLEASFFVPAYQRGYRWSEQQVSELLEDVFAFQLSKEGKSQEGFYCLQPIVVKNLSDEQKWEVVDGQQRLTTVFLILQYLNKRFSEPFQKTLYSIEYETRSGSTEYLAALGQERAEENIDFYFIYQASRTIEEWFGDKPNLVNDFESTLLNQVKVIWYELPVGDSAINAFTRLNVGKIPLTNAELVRALFLRSKNFPQTTASLEQLKIAQEWDLMEKSLQEDDFWYFLTNSQDIPNRIELIFDLITAANAGSKIQKSDPYASFHYFDGLLSANEAPDGIWNVVKQHFMTLDEWYRDDKLFHLVGYLINEGNDVLELMALSRSSTKHEFRKLLKDRIFKQCIFKSDEETCSREDLADLLNRFLSDLEYGKDSQKIKSLLLLFNIASIVANDKSIVRFRFDYFKKESWDIEHIRSVDSSRPTANIDKRPWLEIVRDYFDETGDGQELRQQVQAMLESQSYTTGDAFDELYDETLKHFKEYESAEAENGIGNLALLDSRTNRGYKNAVFPIKRRKLMQYDQEGTFVPLCTRNAFLKCYSQNLENMFFWGDSDQSDYRLAMVDTLSEFFVN